MGGLLHEGWSPSAAIKPVKAPMTSLGSSRCQWANVFLWLAPTAIVKTWLAGMLPWWRAPNISEKFTSARQQQSPTLLPPLFEVVQSENKQDMGPPPGYEPSSVKSSPAQRTNPGGWPFFELNSSASWLVMYPLFTKRGRTSRFALPAMTSTLYFLSTPSCRLFLHLSACDLPTAGSAPR